MPEHKHLYLAPKCMDSPYEGRMWCENDSPQDCECIDGPHAWVKYSLAKEAKAEIDAKDANISELVKCLSAAFADPMRLINSEGAMNETAALVAKHRPDAFAKWADGLIENEG